MKRNRKGFTLIELLVVIAIIGLLLAMIAPVMGSAREKVHIATCANNLKQIAMAAFMYADDHNSVVPDVSQTGNYVQDSNDVYKCPQDTRTGLGINNSSYTAWEYTPVSLLPAALGGLPSLPSETALYLETDKAGQVRSNIKKEDVKYRHDGRTVAVFADGHVLSCSSSSINAILLTGYGDDRNPTP